MVNRRGARAVCVVESDVVSVCEIRRRLRTYRVDFAKIYLEYRTRTRLLDPQAARAAPSHTRSPTLAYLAYLTTHTPVPVEKSRKNSSDWPWRLEKRVLQIILEGTSLLHGHG